MTDFDLVLRQGLVHDGSGGEPWVGDVAVTRSHITAIAPHLPGRGTRELDVTGCVITPGFINMMSWAGETLIEDGRSMSDVLQGVTLEVMGEGASMGPLNESMRQELQAGGLDGNAEGYRYPVPWTTLCDYLHWLAARGVSCNVASFVGAGTLRLHEAGHDDRPLREDELARMCELLDAEMRGGALGVASALIYPPETAYVTDELVTLARVAASHRGMYASHIRSEGDGLLDAVAEIIEIAKRATVRSEIYHLKAAGRAHWSSLPSAIALIDEARAGGVPVTADMYPYEYSGTSLSACIPPWAHEGGPDAMRKRLHHYDSRAQILADMGRGGWENPFLDAGADHVQVRGPLPDPLAALCGSTLAEIAVRTDRTPQTVAMDLIRDTPHDILALYFEMDPAGVRQVSRQPWVSFCSDAESLSTEMAQRDGAVHPRAFGAFARVLGHHVRDQGDLTLPEAIRRMTSLPADNLGLSGRGRLLVGNHADVVVLDAGAVADHATPEEPAAYASGVVHVLVNGTPVVLDGTHTSATPGRFVPGPGVTQRSREAVAER